MRKLDNRALLKSSRAYHPNFADVCILKGHAIPFEKQQIATERFISFAEVQRMKLKIAIAKGARILPIV